MYEFISETLIEMYEQDYKKLRTNTILYGDLEEGRWHTHLQPSLSEESINQWGLNNKQKIPVPYKRFLSYYNGCYLFDLLNVAGVAPITYKGLSIEEESFTSLDLRMMNDIYRSKRTPENHFIFADSSVKNSYYVIDTDEKVLEIDFSTKKIKETHNDLKSFFNKIIQEGKENMKNNIYFEFQ